MSSGATQCAAHRVEPLLAALGEPVSTCYDRVSRHLISEWLDRRGAGAERIEAMRAESRRTYRSPRMPGADRFVVAEVAVHHARGGDQVSRARGGDVDGDLRDVGQVGTGRLQRGAQVEHQLLGLPGHVTDGDGGPRGVDRARAGGQDQARGASVTEA